jgi:hypothetical protein
VKALSFANHRIHEGSSDSPMRQSEMLSKKYGFIIPLAEPCLAYLTLDKFAGLQIPLHVIDFPEYKALEYALSYRIFHLQSDSQRPEVQTTALQFLASKTWREANMREVYFLSTQPRHLALLHILTYLRLPELCFIAIDGASRNLKNQEVDFFSSY